VALKTEFGRPPLRQWSQLAICGSSNNQNPHWNEALNGTEMSKFDFVQHAAPLVIFCDEAAGFNADEHFPPGWDRRDLGWSFMRSRVSAHHSHL